MSLITWNLLENRPFHGRERPESVQILVLGGRFLAKLWPEGRQAPSGRLR
jgi:hypothetical protein